MTTPESHNNLLQIKNLSFSFPKEEGRFVAINKVSFDLKKGESIGLVGESGSGKSLTALSLLQLAPEAGNYDEGQVLWKGEDVLKLSGKALQTHRGGQIGMIFQEPLSALNPVMRCGHQITEALLLHKTKDKKQANQLCLEWLAKVRLQDPPRIFDAYPHQLSGGQRQRVMIAMALCTEPELLVADEPTTALDVTIQSEILDLIKTLRTETGVSVLFISHDLGVVRQITDRVLVMKDGEIVESGSTNELFKAPKHPYTKGLIACRPPLYTKLARLPVINDFLTNTDAELAATFSKYALDKTESEKRITQLAAAPTVLKVDDLSVWFTKEKNHAFSLAGWLGKPKSFTKAVDGISFELKKGQRIGIVGESGSGKTTLGRAIIRLANAKAGEIIYKDQNILSLTEAEFRDWRKNIQMVFQDPFSSLNPRITIGQALAEPLNYHQQSNETDAQVLKILERVGLGAEFINRYPHALSGGQRQRVGLARALLLNPEILICDESVSALDVSVQAQVLNLILDLQEEFNFSLLFISHDLSVVKFIADDLLVMKNGQVVERGSADDIFENAQHPYTQKLIAAIPVF